MVPCKYELLGIDNILKRTKEKRFLILTDSTTGKNILVTLPDEI
jgi:hypothetical protein